jgi:hypothetical protein
VRKILILKNYDGGKFEVSHNVQNLLLPLNSTKKKYKYTREKWGIYGYTNYLFEVIEFRLWFRPAVTESLMLLHQCTHLV